TTNWVRVDGHFSALNCQSRVVERKGKVLAKQASAKRSIGQSVNCVGRSTSNAVDGRHDAVASRLQPCVNVLAEVLHGIDSCALCNVGNCLLVTIGRVLDQLCDFDGMLHPDGSKLPKVVFVSRATSEIAPVQVRCSGVASWR